MLATEMRSYPEYPTVRKAACSRYGSANESTPHCHAPCRAVPDVFLPEFSVPPRYPGPVSGDDYIDNSSPAHLSHTYHHTLHVWDYHPALLKVPHHRPKHRYHQ